MRKILSLVLGLLWALPALAALPSGYTELEYIESTGTQYIDTGIQKGRFVHDIAFTVRDNKNLMGNSAGAGSYWGQNRGNAEDGFEFGSSKIFTSSLIRQTVVFNTIPTKTTLTANGETVASASSVASSTYYVFAINGATDLYRASAKLWSLKIYDENDELIKNLVPAKNPDDKIGMYDTVLGQFYENAGSGEFVAGPVVEIKIATTKYNETKFSPLNTALANAISVVDTVVSNTITQAASIATLQAQKQTRPNDIADDNEKCPAGKKCLLVEDASGVSHWYEIVENAWDLPVGYTQLQWIKSTGAQWIDTGYVLNSNTDNVEIVFQADSVDTNINLFGARGSTTSRPYTFGAYQGGWRFGWYDRSEVFGTADTNKHTVKIEHTGGILKIDDVIIAEMGSESFTTPFNAALFGVMANSMYYGTFTIYSYKKWTNDELVQYFIPAQRNSDNVIGMYDTVSGQFFTNQGTGEFIAGAPVSE